METVFLHGLGQDASAWEQVIKAMGTDSAGIVPDLFPIEPCTFETLYTRFAKYCDSECPDTFNLCGLSLGGMLALKYAINHPERVGKLVLIGAQAKMPAIMLKLQNLIFRMLPERTFDNSGLGKKQVLELTRSMLKLDFTEELSSLSCPTLVVCGEKDVFNIKAARYLNENIPNSTLRLIAKANHEVNKDNPNELAKILKDFL